MQDARSYDTIDKFDRIYGNLIDVCLNTKPTTIETVEPLTGRVETFVIQTLRHHERGDYIVIKRMDDAGVVRLVLPPKVANTITSQRDSLTKRRRSITSKNTMKARKAAGEVIGFQKKRA